MPLVSMRQLLDHAAENGYGLPAFNVNNMEQVWAIMEAAAQVDAPVIMQASAGARKYAGEPFLRHQILAALEAYPNIPIVMHQDHGQSPSVCMGAIRSGFSSVMMDGSLLAEAEQLLIDRGVVEKGDLIALTIGEPIGTTGGTNTLKIVRVGEHQVD